MARLGHAAGILEAISRALTAKGLSEIPHRVVMAFPPPSESKEWRPQARSAVDYPKDRSLVRGRKIEVDNAWRRLLARVSIG